MRLFIRKVGQTTLHAAGDTVDLKPYMIRRDDAYFLGMTFGSRGARGQVVELELGMDREEARTLLSRVHKALYGYHYNPEDTKSK